MINERNESMNSQLSIKGLLLLVGSAVAIIGGLSTFTVETIRGNEVGVRETWSGGIDPNPLPPKMYFRNRFTTDIYHYDASSQVFVMNDTPTSAGEKSKGREVDPYLVQSSDGQDMHINLNVRWRIDTSTIIQLHKTYHAHMSSHEHDILEERLIRPAVMRIVKNHATEMKAIDAYSGEGLVRLQSDIEKDLSDPKGDIRQNGIIVDNFVIEKIVLDKTYTDEIKGKQVAIQKKLRNDQETIAAEAAALKVKAEAQADLNRAVVEAERDKQVAILKAEQDAKKVTIAAEAERSSAEAKASAIKALGEANAAAERLKFSAYSAPGSEKYVQIEVSKQMAIAFGGIKGYLPQGMTLTLLSDSFTNAVKSIMSSHEPAIEAPPVK